MFARMAPFAQVLLAVPARALDQPAPAPMPPAYFRDMPVEKIAADLAAGAVLNKDLPGLLSDAQYPLFKSMSLKQLQSASGGDLSEEDVDKTVADLQALPAH
jgi:hypothetical protein